MIPWRESRSALAALLACVLACTPGHALVRLNDGRDRIHVTVNAGVSHDSNIYANSDNQGDVIYSTGITADYTRRAGWIGVNASVSLASAQFGDYRDEDYSNPGYTLEFTKQSGRTTGSLAFRAQRESRADAAVNLRSDSWNYSTDLNVKYPINGVLSAAGNIGYSGRHYIGETLFADLDTYAASVDVFYVLSSNRDLSFGYRYRFNETSRTTSASDHGINVGLHGRLIRGVRGGLQVGYQTRKPDSGFSADSRLNSWTAAGSAALALGRRISLTGQIAKDFSVTATDASVDRTSATLDLRYVYSSRWSGGVTAGWGRSEFLGEMGRIVLEVGPPVVLGPARQDDYLSLSASIDYTLNEHLRVSATYSKFQNWSTLAYADFIRNAWSVNLSSRW